MLRNTLQKPHLKHRFDTLDALRGIAALVVLLFHGPGSEVVPHGYMAVDFFFMLSGFVVTFAYQEKLDQGWSIRSFLMTRLIRLYPLYLAGMFLGLFTTLVLRHLQSIHITNMELGIAVFLGVLLLPVPGGFPVLGSAAFPLNLPAWSLFCEIAANVYHALFLRRRSLTAMIGIVCVFAASVLYGVHRLGTLDFGSRRSDVLWGLLRVGFSYNFGALLFVVWRKGYFRFSVPAIALFLVFIGLLIAPVSGSFKTEWDVLAAFLVFPILLIVGANSHVPAPIARMMALLADASYAIYILHVPFLELFARVWARLLHHAEMPNWAGIVAITVVFAIFMDRKFDVPLRRWIRRRLVREQGTDKIDLAVSKASAHAIES